MDQAEDPPNQAGVNLTPGRSGNIPPVEHRWKKGQSGNPRGRTITAATDKLLESPDVVQKVIDALFKRIEDGDVRAIELLWNRHEGLLTQRTENDTRQTIVREIGSEETPP